MARFQSIPGQGYGSAHVDSLIAGGPVWNTSNGPITLFFGNPTDKWEALAAHGPGKSDGDWEYLDSANNLDDYWNYGSTGSWTFQDEKDPFLFAAQYISSITQVSFALAPSLTTADMVLWQVDLPENPRVFASSDTPDHDPNPQRNQSWLYFDVFEDGSWDQMQPGGFGFTMMLNMFGTALGLAHPHSGGTQPGATPFPGVTSPYDYGDLELNQAPYTAMSSNYNLRGYENPEGNWGAMKSFGAFDIAALQRMYGANTTTAAGNDVYVLPVRNYKQGLGMTAAATGWTCIWDTGGIDTINGASATDSVTIDLRAATLANGDPNAGGFLSRQVGVAGGFTIANGAVIENAIGGRGNDTLIGNSAANRLEGGAGDDTYYIDGANDVVVDTSGNDTVYATFNYAGAGIENVYVNGVKVVSGGVVTGTGANPIRGTAGNNTLVGKDTNDKLYGGLGNDKLTGKGGLDIFVFNTTPDKRTNKDTVTDFKVADDTIWLDNKIFKKLGSKGSEKSPAKLKSSFFKASDKAKDKDDYLIYNKKTGVLSYDVDGSGKGQAVEFALLKKNLTLKNDDFAVI